jgi:DNA-binding CsgD family transcriptional regulator
VLSPVASEVFVLCSHSALSDALVAALRTSGWDAARFAPDGDVPAGDHSRILVGPVTEGSPEAKVIELLNGDVTIVLGESVTVAGAQTLSDGAGLQDVLVSLQKSMKNDRAVSITPRHAQILQFVAEGLSVQEAATRLGITSKTVNNHLGAVYRRLGVENLTQAVLHAIRAGMIDPARRTQ